ncbi:MAG: hypothetical protein JO029_07625 [Candidatus Eremiobacteraeota bacterium]|nr:hypothetical protein [Candidatus Eremiobacteraeota bacterium]MBV8331681.1 hypothetical protein [Candidatus Eremiobacteraeota bacterium]MBV8434130.1 hypothetical protein [Candidatus Eremiobacteraeota bacterium]MBV8582717.1 hypothetical protein [Candidatus Eremiobacteraeota bacterium]MBV8655617.1 hypothetical protein [Candidatus Eremiobacteraeota bacterium]
MNGDFGAEVDAALNERLEALRGAAEEARSRVDRGADALPVGTVPQTEPSPMFFGDVRPAGPAVSFEGIGDEYELEADSEGIPLPEENL